MEQGKPKNSRGEMIVRILFVAFMAFVIVLFGITMYRMEEKSTRRSENNAAWSQIQQVAMAQIAYCEDHAGTYAAGWNDLARYGFQPDPNIRTLVIIIDLDWGAGRLHGFAVKVNHTADKSEIFAYNSLSGFGIQPVREAQPLGEEYAVTVMSGEGKGEPVRLNGPPFLIIKM